MNEMNKASKSSENPLLNPPECLEDIDDIINFIRQYEPFFVASFSPDSGFSQWVKTALVKKNKKLANTLAAFSSEFLSILKGGGAIDVRKNISQDTVACFIDGITGIELKTFITKNKKGILVEKHSRDARNPKNFKKQGDNLLKEFLVKSDFKVSEYLAFGLIKIEPAIQMWNEFQASNNPSAENKTSIINPSPTLKIKRGTEFFHPKKPKNYAQKTETSNHQYGISLYCNDSCLSDYVFEDESFASSSSSTSSTSSAQKTEPSDDYAGYASYNSDFGLADCYDLDDNFSEDFTSSTSSTSSTSEAPSIPQLTAASMSSLFSEAQHPNTYQQIAHIDAVMPSEKSENKEKKGKKRFFDEIKLEETDNKENASDSDGDTEERDAKRHKTSGCFSGAPTY